MSEVIYPQFIDQPFEPEREPLERDTPDDEYEDIDFDNEEHANW